MGERSDLSEAEQEASRWLVRLESPDVSLDDHKRFRVWLNALPANRAAFEAISRTWDRLDALQHLEREPPRPVLRRRSMMFASLTLAAAAVLALLVFIPAALRPGEVYETGVGERETIRLADGSTVELDAGSRIVVHYESDRREVRLEEGAALFDVRRDAERRFSVETVFGTVRVRGTSFLVKLGGARMRATVIRGIVEGQARRGDLLSRFAPDNQPAPAIAGANQEMAFERAGVTVADIAPQAAQRRLAWRDGMLAFDGETLGEAASEVERQTGMRFEFADPALKHLRVGGYISARDSAAFTELLRDLGVAAERRGDGVIVLRSAT